MTTSATQPQRVPRKPTLLAVINGSRQITMIRLAQAAQVPRNELLTVIQSNTATPRVAEKIARGLTVLTGHQYSVLDIEIAIHPRNFGLQWDRR